MTDAEMIDAATTTSGWRGSRAVWLAAAREALLERGVEAVKIQPLAARLGLSRTSFYWFFKDRAAILDALLEDWEARNTGALIEGCTAYADTLPEAMLNVIAVFLDERRFDPRYDVAMRGWAHGDAAVAARAAEADARRLDAVTGTFLRFGVADQEADVRARTVYLTQVGYISLRMREDLETRIARVPGYVQTYCGVPPTEQDMARFRASLGAD